MSQNHCSAFPNTNVFIPKASKSVKRLNESNVSIKSKTYILKKGIKKNVFITKSHTHLVGDICRSKSLGKINLKLQRDTFRSLANKVKKKNPFDPWHVINKPTLKE